MLEKFLQRRKTYILTIVGYIFASRCIKKHNRIIYIVSESRDRAVPQTVTLEDVFIPHKTRAVDWTEVRLCVLEKRMQPQSIMIVNTFVIKP